MSGGKMIKFQQNQALTPHFESYWSIKTSGNGTLVLDIENIAIQI